MNKGNIYIDIGRGMKFEWQGKQYKYRIRYRDERFYYQTLRGTQSKVRRLSKECEVKV